MQTKPIFIGFAAGILILVVAAASFSAGLYLGQRGYVADLQYQGAQNGPGQFPQGGPPNGQFPQGQTGQQPPNGQFPQGNSPQSGPQAGQPPQNGTGPGVAGGPPGAPSWPPDVMGRIVSITATEIVLDTPNGPVTVAINADTKYLNEQGQPIITVSDLQVDFIIAVFGQPTATTIMHLPPPPNAP